MSAKAVGSRAAVQQGVLPAAGLLFAGIALVVFRREVLALPAVIFNVLVTVCFVTGLTVLYRWDRGKRVSLGFMFAAMYGLFHFGIYMALAFGVDLALVQVGDVSWVDGPWFALAGMYAVLGFFAFVAGYSWIRSRQGAGPVDGLERETAADATSRDGNGPVGGIVALLGLTLWLINVVESGVQFGDNYVVYLAKTAGSAIPWALLLIGLGVAIIGTGTRSLITIMALGAFACWALLAIALGLRGEVLIPIVAYFVGRSRRMPVPFGIRRMAVLGILALSLGSVVRVIRVGVWDRSLVLGATNPAAGLVELGYSIRPLMLAVNWRLVDLEPYVGLATYLAPFRRFLMGTLLGMPVLSVDADPAVFGGVIGTRVGPVGGSVAAEAYRVGGLLALVAVLALIGVIAGWADIWRQGEPLADAAVAMAAFVLLLWIRNDFTPVPFELVVGLLLLQAIRFMAPRSVSRSVARQEEGTIKRRKSVPV